MQGTEKLSLTYVYMYITTQKAGTGSVWTMLYIRDHIVGIRTIGVEGCGFSVAALMGSD